MPSHTKLAFPVIEVCRVRAYSACYITYVSIMLALKRTIDSFEAGCIVQAF